MKRGARHAKSAVMLGLTYVAAIIATLPLLFIIFHLLRQGAAFLRPAFFTEMPKPIGEPGGGMANAIVGTLILVGTASAIGLPVGIMEGLAISEDSIWLVTDNNGDPRGRHGNDIRPTRVRCARPDR